MKAFKVKFQNLLLGNLIVRDLKFLTKPSPSPFCLWFQPSLVLIKNSSQTFGSPFSLLRTFWGNKAFDKKENSTFTHNFTAKKFLRPEFRQHFWFFNKPVGDVKTVVKPQRERGRRAQHFPGNSSVFSERNSPRM